VDQSTVTSQKWTKVRDQSSVHRQLGQSTGPKFSRPHPPFISVRLYLLIYFGLTDIMADTILYCSIEYILTG
jgi:hypothetical protein